ncbi:MAG: flavin reductase [Cytophagales bacterium]|nr:flavin reductase family protein [Bernardetiaceae bacterium]MDW8210790.1 flavin reductase [Cytophagales bacterium]
MTLKRFCSQDFEQMERHYRTNLINSLSGFKSVSLVGTQNKAGITNLAIFSQVFHVGANPALMGILVRPDSVRRDTLANILETGWFTLNHIRAEFFRQAHQTAARYDISEFEAVGLTPIYSHLVKAPYVAESCVRIGLSFAQRHDLTINGTILIIGKVEEIFAPLDCISQDGYLDIEKAGTITCSSLDSYHTTQRLARLSYPKPNQPLKEI